MGRALQPYRRKPAVMISLEDGNPAPDNKMARDRWFRHFKSSLKAKDSDLQALLLEAYAHEVRAFASVAAAGDFNLLNAPGYAFLVTRMAKTEASKSAGTDGIVGEIHRIAPQQAATTLWPNVAKAGWTFSMP